MHNIFFYEEDIKFQLEEKNKTIDWIEQVIKDFSYQLNQLSIIFCSDEYLLQINKEHLNHDYYTDILTFDHSEEEKVIEGDLFISIERVRDNLKYSNDVFEKELHRVIIHGVIHLLGYSDTSEEQKNQMRDLENHYLALQF